MDKNKPEMSVATRKAVAVGEAKRGASVQEETSSEKMGKADFAEILSLQFAEFRKEMAQTLHGLSQQVKTDIENSMNILSQKIEIEKLDGRIKNLESKTGKFEKTVEEVEQLKEDQGAAMGAIGGISNRQNDLEYQILMLQLKQNANMVRRRKTFERLPLLPQLQQCEL
ncbi:Hypothetical predicted protein [Podarcis lilfordi]|uniref:Uncharacterized protein n=1 Tax=Podarcis lilfordi TaxID=74358 RepID=A0AA35LNS1_9SAUR|nr:Hypothetical predicted protein [Podarcis lilfordi]